jgi:hypothetical protein
MTQFLGRGNRSIHLCGSTTSTTNRRDLRSHHFLYMYIITVLALKMLEFSRSDWLSFGSFSLEKDVSYGTISWCRW